MDSETDDSVKSTRNHDDHHQQHLFPWEWPSKPVQTTFGLCMGPLATNYLVIRGYFFEMDGHPYFDVKYTLSDATNIFF